MTNEPILGRKYKFHGEDHDGFQDGIAEFVPGGSLGNYDNNTYYMKVVDPGPKNRCKIGQILFCHKDTFKYYTPLEPIRKVRFSDLLED